MKNKDNNNYISLQEATLFCNYSHEYLGLRARQGRLKSLKLGGVWVTKEEWLKEYIGQTEKRHNNAKLRIQKKLKKRTCLRRGFGEQGQKQRVLLKVLISLTVMSLATSALWKNEAITETFTGTLIVFKEYGQWVSSQTASVSQQPYQEEKEPILIKRIYDDKL